MPSLSASEVHPPPQTPRTSSWFPSQSQSPSGVSEHPPRKCHRTIADATRVERAHTVVDVVTIPSASSASQSPPHAEDVELVSVAVAIAFGDVRTSAFVDLPRTVADAAGVECANAVIHVVTDAIGIGVRRAVATTDAQGIELVAVAVAVAFRDVSASTFVNLSRTVADATSVVRAHQSSTSSQMPSASASAAHPRHRRPRRRVGFRRSRNHRRGCRRIRIRRSHRGHCRCHASSSHARQHRHRCHRHRRLPCSRPHTRQGRRVGSRRSRNRRRGCRCIRTRRFHPDRCNAAGVKLISVAVTVSLGEVCAPALVDFTGPLQMPHARRMHPRSRRRHHKCLVEVCRAVPPHSPRASMWYEPSSSLASSA